MSDGRDPFRDEPRPRRRWVLPAIIGGVAALAGAAVAVTLVLRPASEPEAAKPSSGATSAAPSSSASPKPPAQPSPRIRIDCESILDRAAVTAYLGAAPTVHQDTADYLPDLAWLQKGGLGCSWKAGDRGLRVTAIPRSGVPEVEVFRHEGSDPGLPIATMPADAPLVECDPLVAVGCGARAATDALVVYVFDNVTPGDGGAAFAAIATAAIGKVVAAPVRPLWAPPYPLTVDLPETCEGGIDPAGVVARALDRAPGEWSREYASSDSLDALVVIVREANPLRCASSTGLPTLTAAPGGRWAWDAIAGGELRLGAQSLAVAGADAAIFYPNTDGYGGGRLTLVAGDAILQFTGEAPSGSDQAWLTRAAEAWLARYAA